MPQLLTLNQPTTPPPTHILHCKTTTTTKHSTEKKKHLNVYKCPVHKDFSILVKLFAVIIASVYHQQCRTSGIADQLNLLNYHFGLFCFNNKWQCF